MRRRSIPSAGPIRPHDRGNSGADADIRCDAYHYPSTGCFVCDCGHRAVVAGCCLRAAGACLATHFGPGAELDRADLRSIGQAGSTIGLGLLFDTLVVRSLMTPSVAALLGRWFWWPQRVRPRPASYKLRPFGRRRLVRSLLLGEDVDAVAGRPKTPSPGKRTRANSSPLPRTPLPPSGIAAWRDRVRGVADAPRYPGRTFNLGPIVPTARGYACGTITI